MLNSSLANHTGPAIRVNEFKLQFQNGQVITPTGLDLTNNNDLQFIVGFEGVPDTVQQFRVLAQIRKRDTENGVSGRFIVDRRATTVQAVVGLQANPSRVTVAIEHEHPTISNEEEIPEAIPFKSILPPFHLGPGIYDLVAELTPEDQSGPREDLKIGLSYTFEGIIPPPPPETPPVALENADKPEALLNVG